MSDILKYHKKDFVNAEKYNRVKMSGMYDQLGKIAKAIDEIHYRAEHMTYDIEWHGWSKADAENMHKIEDDICRKLREIYYICLQGRGEYVADCFEDNDDDKYQIPEKGLELDFVDKDGKYYDLKFIKYEQSDKKIK